MSQKGFSLLFALLLSSIALLFCAFVYIYSKSENPIELFYRPIDQKTIFEEKSKQRMESLKKKKPSEVSPISTEGMAMSNPASEYCIRVGGDLVTEVRGDGGEYNICKFADNMSCEEWALYNRKCPLGGIKTTGFDNKEQKYCALIGGQTIAVPNSNCKLPNGHTCSNEALYNGKCS